MEAWQIFEQIVLISPLDSEGYLTLSNAQVYINSYPCELPFSHSQFWFAMGYFLNRENHKIAQKRRSKRGKSNNS